MLEAAAASAEPTDPSLTVAARGWSFWDIFSFRERMARLRATGA